MSKSIAYIKLVRPHHYLKNGFVWLPLFFGYKISDFHAIMQTLVAFIAFCLAASAIYIINDITDIEKDRRHPQKKRRPLASGAIGKTEAILVFTGVLSSSLIISFAFLPAGIPFIISAYLLLNFAYSFKLKHLPIIDVVCIAAGFVFRVFAGGLSAEVAISHWIIMMTFLMALFLALAKRRDDLLLSKNGLNTRKSIEGYNLEFVSVCMVMLASITIVSYILYTVSPAVVRQHGNYLYMTGFWVILGFLRYIQITLVEHKSGSPTLVLVRDFFLQMVILFWGLNCFVLLYVLKK